MIFFKISNHTQNMLVLFLKGIAMGAANKIPGVSGGFIAFILGFYEKLIHSLKNINYNVERKPLGTAGGLSVMKFSNKLPIIAINANSGRNFPSVCW